MPKPLATPAGIATTRTREMPGLSETIPLVHCRGMNGTQLASLRCVIQAFLMSAIKMPQPLFLSALPYQNDVLCLPVEDLDAAADWYGRHFAMKEVARCVTPHPGVILERDGVQIGFAVNGGDASQDGAAVRVNHIDSMKAELEASGLQVSSVRIDEHNGHQRKVFFVVAPDGLCYCFNELLND